MTGFNFISRSADTPQRLAALFYGDFSLYGLIVDYNPNSFADNISIPGTLIFIPDPLTEEIEHTINSGDSYESLSLQYYGTERYSNKIANENNIQILTESIGLLLSIPALLDIAIYRNALKRKGL